MKKDRFRKTKVPDTGAGTDGPMAKTERRWLVLLLILAAAFRFYSSVYGTARTHPDDATHAMMVQHVAEGRHFPLMFYNSPYVGMSEVYLGAVFHRLLPHSLLPSLLGFALVSFLALPFFYLWARRAAGIRAARYGLALLVIGSPFFFFLNSFIGYPSVLMCGMAACWLTTRVIDKLRSGGGAGLDAFFLGIFAGLGWWTNNLTVVFLVPCAILVAVFAPWRKWAVLAAGGAAGFVLGAGPWIIYSIRDAAALQFVTDASVSRGSFFLHNVRTAVGMIPTLLDVGFSGDQPLRRAASAALVLLVLASLISWFRNGTGTAGLKRRHALRLMPWLIIASNIAICGFSNRFAHVPAVRYLLPVVPATAILAGTGAAWLAGRRALFFRGAGLFCLAVILAGHFSRLPSYWDSDYRESRDENRRRVEELATFCEEQGIEALRGDFFLQSMTFASSERLKITSYPNYFDRYRPFREAAILTPNLGVMNDYYGLSGFLAATRGSARTGRAGGVFLHWNLERVPPRFAYLDPGEVESARWEDGDPARKLLDGNLDTPLSAWHHDRRRPRGRERTVELRFRSPRRVVGVHAWGPSGYWASVLRVTAGGGNGPVSILHDGGHYGWFWSGSYPFLAGYLAHCEVLFPAVTTDTLAVTVPASTRDNTPLVSELRVLTESGPLGKDLSGDCSPGRVDYAGVLIDRLREDPPPMLYAPRWIAERTRRELPEIPNIIPADYYLQYEGPDRYPPYPVVKMDRLPGALLVTPNAALERTTALLEKRGWIPEAEADLGPHTVIRVHDNPRGDASDLLYWTEYGAFLATDHFSGDELDTEAFLPLLEEPIRFPRGAALESVVIEDPRRRPGESTRMVYRWRCPPGFEPRQWAVFVHFRQGRRIVFQDDHIWLEDIDPEAIARQPDGWLFTIGRDLKVPEDAPPGEYTIVLGLYHRVTHERLKPRGPVKLEHQAVIIPGALAVEEFDKPE